jgi:uncharacterized protein (TIGR02145 family)
MKHLFFLSVFFLTGLILNGQQFGSFVDQRDDKTYKTVKIGEQIWMRENLNFDMGKGSWCYDKDSKKCDEYGRLYNWKTAMNACPDGWHLPTKEEFEKMLLEIEWTPELQFRGIQKGGSKGFDALFAGGRGDRKHKGEFYGLGEGTFFWTSTESSNKKVWFLNILKEFKEAKLYEWGVQHGFSVRCVKD